ncbi:MAG: hypothetical protein NC041_09340 [Bacteroides sp.]|nr:hypothetical protein [Prevotella sp.]MCM1408740.1 hypothetical protein [Treponema brennaborense]MCM1470655.1 hypothetical protein [Bacteroides sp.]
MTADTVPVRRTGTIPHSAKQNAVSQPHSEGNGVLLPNGKSAQEYVHAQTKTADAITLPQANEGASPQSTDNISRPQAESPQTASASYIQSTAGGISADTAPAYTDFFARLDMQADAASVQIVRFMQQMGAKIEPMQIKRIKRTAENVSFGKKKQAAETAALLEEKGMHANAGAVESMLAALHADTQDAGDYNRREKHQHGRYVPGSIDIIDRLYRTPPADMDDAGMLALANHCAGKNLHWIMLPFEFDTQDKTESARTGTDTASDAYGSVRILCDIRRKTALKTVVCMQTKTEELRFLLMFPRTIRFAAAPQLSAAAQKIYKAELQRIFTPLSWTDISYDDSIMENVFFHEQLSVLPERGIIG